MEKNITDKEKISELIKYYENKKLLIVGLNDSQGVNVNSTFFKKGLLEYIASILSSKNIDTEIINAFSLSMNKTEHIDYFLKHNLTLEEIKLSQIYSTVSALQKVMSDLGLPKVLGEIGNLSRIIYTPKSGDEKIKISTSLKEAEEPIVIYSSGVNNLMREVGNNPFSIKRDFNKRNETPNYYYTLEKSKNDNTLKVVFDSIERNFNNILGINNKTDIYALGTYIPKSLQYAEMDIFRDLIIRYNIYLEKLCKEYGVTFINTEEVGNKYVTGENNFHITSSGHNVLARDIIEKMYDKKISNHTTYYKEYKPFEILDNGSKGMLFSILEDYEKRIDLSKKLSNYEEERNYAILDEHAREESIFVKVLINKK